MSSDYQPHSFRSWTPALGIRRWLTWIVEFNHVPFPKLSSSPSRFVKQRSNTRRLECLVDPFLVTNWCFSARMSGNHTWPLRSPSKSSVGLSHSAFLQNVFFLLWRSKHRYRLEGDKATLWRLEQASGAGGYLAVDLQRPERPFMSWNKDILKRQRQSSRC